MGTDDTDSLSATGALLGRPRRLAGTTSGVGDFTAMDASASTMLFLGRPLGREVEAGWTSASGAGVVAVEVA